MIEDVRKYDRSYFEGRVYKNEGYRDFLWHQYTVNEILKRKPNSVLELGCGRGYIVKHLICNDIPAVGFDISTHAFLTRATNGMFRADLTYSDIWEHIPKMDMSFSMAFLEHIKEECLPSLIAHMIEKTNFGLHGITFEDPLREDPTHVTLRPKAWWYSQFRQVDGNYPVEIFEKTELERPPPGGSLAVPMGKENLKKINFGSHTNMFYYGWLNVDVHDLGEFAKVNGYEFLRWDVRRPLPFEDNSIDKIVSHHMLEHLTYEDGERFLRECYRILKPRGVIRIGIPDIDILTDLYVSGNVIKSTKDFNIESEKAKHDSEAFFKLIAGGHASGYDSSSLSSVMDEVGFKTYVRGFDASIDNTITKETIDSYPSISSYVDGIKPRPIIQEDPSLFMRAYRLRK